MTGDVHAPVRALPWHRRPGALARVVADIVASELTRLRPGGVSVPSRSWQVDLLLDERGLGLDSLERLSLASTLSEALHLDESGVDDLLLARRTVGEWIDVAATGLAACDARLTFRTSGSSGTAKACRHALADLVQEAAFIAGMTRGAGRVLSAVPAHHMYGFLCTVLLPDQLGDVEVLDVRQMTPHAVVGAMQPGDLVVSHPAHWALVSKFAAHIPSGVHGVTSTAPCPDALASRLLRSGLESLTQLYGSSETAGVGSRAAPGAPFTLMPFWTRASGDVQHLVRQGADGASARHVLPDRLEWIDDRHFVLGGRFDDAVQVGGMNVFPARVREVLLEHPRVSDAAVRLMSDDADARLKAFVVAAPGTDHVALHDDLWRWTASRLSVPERPKAFAIGDALPRNALGKLSDWPLAAAHIEVPR